RRKSARFCLGRFCRRRSGRWRRRCSGTGPAGSRFFLHHDRERSSGAMNLAALALENSEQSRLISQTWIIRRENISSWSFILRLFHRTLRFQIEVFQKKLAVLIEIIERDQKRGLFVVIVVALRPFCAWQRRVLLVPGALVLVW